MQTKFLEYLTLRKLVMSRALKIHDPFVPDPSKAFSQYDSAPHTDRCINCEKSKKIIGTITLGNKSGPICVKCFKSYQE
mgnify:FL=1|jgi:hypothetical protein